MAKEIIIVGAGNRAMIYAKYAIKHPERMKIVGVVDPSSERIKRAKRVFELTDDQCFESVEELIKKPKFAHAVINGTMDSIHVETSIPLLEKGYDLLLEKPIGVSYEEIESLLHIAKKHDRKVMICHVLRYTPFYHEIKKLVSENIIGDIFNIQTTEHVRLDHMITSYVKGKWANKEISGASMLLAKACHDLDIISWMNNGIKPVKVSSFGNDFVFNRENKPEECTEEGWYCEHCQNSIYSPYKMYIENPDRWLQYVWTEFENKENVTIEDKIKSMENGNPYGKCVWSSNKNVVDQQSIMIEFENGSIATFNMVGGTPRSQRRIHLVGTLGEIIGTFEDNKITIRKYDSETKEDYVEEVIQFDSTDDQIGAFGDHGGGDEKLIEDFVNYLYDEPAPLTRTTLEDSIVSHKLVFLADKSMNLGKQLSY